MLPGKGRVPTFNLKPHPLLTGALVVVLLGGVLLAMSFYSKDDGSGRYSQKAEFTLVVTFVISGCLLIMATAKMWFPHLWRRNRTHKMHHRTKHHHAHRRHHSNRD